jgi:SAM-dependent methyltransferase
MLDAMLNEGVFAKINESKADLDRIYNRPDPRAYFRELGKLDYAIPAAAKPIFRTLIHHLKRRRPGPVQVLDLGCSYGVNAALLKHDISLSDLYYHWGQARLVEATAREVVEYDRRFFGKLEEVEDVAVIGLDRAENAVAFAEETGLLDQGVVADLETEPLRAPLERELASVDLVISTGCVGYVTEQSFRRLLPAVSEDGQPWFANFVLRMFPFEAIAQTLAEAGYVTEKLEERTFVQRRFASGEEYARVLSVLRDRGVDPAGKEAEGCLHAEFFLSRPAAEARLRRLPRLLAGA